MKIPYDLTGVEVSKPTGLDPDDVALENEGQYWIDAEDQVWRIKEMTTSHLVNVIGYLMGRAAAIHLRDSFDAAMGAASFNPDSMAAYYADQEVDRMMSMSPEQYIDALPVVEAMRAELAKRKGAA